MKISDFFNGRLRELIHSGLPYRLSFIDIDVGPEKKRWHRIIDENGISHSIDSTTFNHLEDKTDFPKVCEKCNAVLYATDETKAKNPRIYRGYFCEDVVACKKRVDDEKKKKGE